ncbi:hypothetical protein KQ300_02290 [Synechococcus sp. CS-1331]|uniref:hypothetical protein n=1 Tax=Synechococcus sp. CS-1331 TaxID=2847973 RepID=UPI00199F68E6|nr:hypothetical protein [Synechococcus sp. CS-1331]MCT0227028.1 hypothetical protein [Synechococcus sp. CS-1331]NQW38842.1 hypothetical protein [Cyanobacteria bacterium bin.275]
MASVPNLVETCELAERDGNRNAALLLGFALGRSSDLEVMEQLHPEHEEDLFLLMAQAHLPLPRLADQATEAMVSELQQLV